MIKTRVSWWLQRAGDFVNRQPGFVVLFFTVFYLAFTLPTAAVKPFWYDELFTRVVATRSSIGEILAVLQQGWDLHPPFYYLLARAGSALSATELGLRLPSIVGFWLGSVCLFLHLRRLIPPVFAASALFLPWLTMVAPLAVEARPYALLFCFASAALFFWTESLTTGDRWPLAGLFLAMVAVSMVHYYGFTAFVALGAGKIVHTVRRRRVRWGVWILMALACVPAALHWPLVHEAMAFSSEGAWNSPRLSVLTQIYQPGKNNVLIGLLAIVVTALLSLRTKEPSGISVEIVTAWVLTILAPAIGVAIAVAISGMITERYVLFCHAGGPHLNCESGVWAPINYRSARDLRGSCSEAVPTESPDSWTRLNAQAVGPGTVSWDWNVVTSLVEYATTRTIWAWTIKAGVPSRRLVLAGLRSS